MISDGGDPCVVLKQTVLYANTQFSLARKKSLDVQNFIRAVPFCAKTIKLS